MTTMIKHTLNLHDELTRDMKENSHDPLVTVTKKTGMGNAQRDYTSSALRSIRCFWPASLVVFEKITG